MADERIGSSFSIDITNLKAGLAQANRMIRESESEFKAAAAGMDDWSSSAKGVSDRIKYLNTATDLQKKKVAALQEQYKKLIADGLDPTSKKAIELRTQINREQTALNKNEKELKQQTKALEEMGDESENTAKDTEKLTDSTGKTGKGFAALKGTAAIGVAAIVAIGAAAIAGVKNLLSLSESTRELRTNMAKLETGFTSNKLSAEDATKTYKTLYGVLGDTGKATEAAGHLALLANSSEDLAKWTDICTGVYAQFGDSLPIEGLTEAANETAKTGDLVGVLTDALNWAGESETKFQEKLDACSTEQERQKLITETLNKLYSEQSDKFKELNKDVIAANEAAADLAQAQADLGAAAEPLNTKITELKTSILTELSPALNQMLQDLTGVLDGTEGAPEKLGETIGGMIDTILTKAVEILPAMGEMATSLILTFVETIINQLPEIINSALTILTSFIDTLSNKIPDLIPVVINAVLTIADNLINNVDKIIDAGIKLILGLADGLVKALPQLVAKIPVIIEKLLSAILNNLPKLLNAGVELIISLGNGLIKAIPQLIAQLPTIISHIIKGLLTEGVPALIQAGADLLSGLFKGMLNPSVIWDNIKKIGGGIIDGFKDFFGIKSPSKLFRDQIGEYLGEGMALGLGDGFENKIKGVNRAIVKSIQLDSPTVAASVNGGENGLARTQGGVVINQYNTYSQSHSRYELFKTKQQTAAAVRLAVAGGVK